ncbi:MAG: hypothetical protein JJT96_17345 [Opitutales bacterium]|nr:hypothetical protein [Opitutales bacterium]
MSLLDQHDGKWKVTDRLALWESEGPLLTDELLDRFAGLAVEVLLEGDPKLELPKDKRFAAAIYGHERKYSRQIRESIAETLALVGGRSSVLKTCTGEGLSIARRVVGELLHEADARQWASLDDVLPLLAEASPEAFLDAAAAASERSDGPFVEVFAEEGDMFSGGTFMTGLLWGLEALAWSEEYLTRVCLILANLAAVDPGGQWANRPINSLRDILLPWLPQTVANMETRHGAVRAVVREQPMVGWELVLKLLPQAHSSSSGTHRPRWQEFIPEEWESGVTKEERRKAEGNYADLALELAGNDPQRLIELIPYYFDIHPDSSRFGENLRSCLQSEEILALPEELRLALWMALTNKTSNHRKYADSEAWAVPEEALQELDEVADKIKPMEPEIRHRRLFAGREFELYEAKGDWEDQSARLLEHKMEAIQEILARSGFSGLQAFWRSVEAPNEVGHACGSDDSLSLDGEVLPATLASGVEADRRFAFSYVWRRFHRGEWEWVDSIDRTAWSIEAKAGFLSILPFVNEVWTRVETELREHESEYWKQTRVHPESGHLERMDFALGKLIEYSRPDAVIHCLWMGKLWTEPFLELGLRALETLDQKQHRIDPFTVQEAFKHLQADASVDAGRLAATEYKFLRLLERPGEARPRTLYRQLAEHPGFFCEVIRTVYRSKNEVSRSETDDAKVNGAAKTMAEQAYHLLRGWNYPPGRMRDGSFNGERLKEWVAEVKGDCLASGHWEVASHQIGEVLYFAPQDESGLWPEAVCELLDSKEDPEFRRGLSIRIFNSRGAQWFSGGEREIELAEKWERVARSARDKVYPRLEETLRSLAKTYREDAKRSVVQYQHRFD